MPMTIEEIVEREVPCSCPLVVGRGVFHLDCDKREARQAALAVARAVVEECAKIADARKETALSKNTEREDAIAVALDGLQLRIRALAAPVAAKEKP